MVCLDIRMNSGKSVAYLKVVHNVYLGPSHVIRKRSLEQPLRIYLMYDESVTQLPMQEQNLVRNDLIPNAVAYWEETLSVRQTSWPIRLLRQCQSVLLRFKDYDPYPYCVDGCAPVTVCGNITVPEQHLEACRIAPVNKTHEVVGVSGPGVVNADFILYVSAKETHRCDIGTTVAYAAYCQLERTLDRPVAGYVNLCPNAISTKAHDIHQMRSTIRHEILHALGFSAGLYAFFRDDYGDPLTKRALSTGKPPFNHKLELHQWSEKVVKKVTRSWKTRTGYFNKTVHVLVTPRVKREVRDHFNCSELEGAELEDQGVVGTALTHWEKRIFENEVMTGTYTQNPMISRITLALMEDTGWYKANYNKAEPLLWGKNLGCNFVLRSCMEWMQMRKSRELAQHGLIPSLTGIYQYFRKENIHPYCNRVKLGSLQTECTDERDAVAVCNLVKYKTTLPSKYQHFDKIDGVPTSEVGSYGGRVELADYCPYIQEFNWKKGQVVVRGSRCNIHENNADPDINYTLEQYGNQSKCFDHFERWSLRDCHETHQVQHWGSGCYQYTCDEKHGLRITVHDKEYACYSQGQTLKVTIVTNGWLHEGDIVCPSCQELCQPRGIQCPAEISPPQKFEEPIEAPCTACSILYNQTVVMTTQIIVLLLFSIRS